VTSGSFEGKISVHGKAEDRRLDILLENMGDHMTTVVEEAENQMTAAEATNINGQEEFGHGEKFRVDRRKLEQMLQGMLTNHV
jgi:hypothetical protein